MIVLFAIIHELIKNVYLLKETTMTIKSIALPKKKYQNGSQSIIQNIVQLIDVTVSNVLYASKKPKKRMFFFYFWTALSRKTESTKVFVLYAEKKWKKRQCKFVPCIKSEKLALNNIAVGPGHRGRFISPTHEWVVGW